MRRMIEQMSSLLHLELQPIWHSCVGWEPQLLHFLVQFKGCCSIASNSRSALLVPALPFSVLFVGLLVLLLVWLFVGPLLLLLVPGLVALSTNSDTMTWQPDG